MTFVFIIIFLFLSRRNPHCWTPGTYFLPLNFCFNEDGEPSNQKQQLALCEPTPRPSWLEEFQNLIFLPSSFIYGFIFLLYLLSNQIEIGLGIEPKTWDSKQNISKYQSAIKPIPPLITPLYYLSLIICYTNNCEFFFFFEKSCVAYIQTYWFQYVVMNTSSLVNKSGTIKGKTISAYAPKGPPLP